MGIKRSMCRFVGADPPEHDDQVPRAELPDTGHEHEGLGPVGVVAREGVDELRAGVVAGPP